MQLEKFLSAKHQGYTTVAGIEPVITVGDPFACATAHAELMANAAEQGAEIIVGPELGNGGYTMHQLWSDQLFRRKAREALKSFLEMTAMINAILLYGTGLVFDGILFNCMVVCFKGEIQAVIVKMYLPVNGNHRESDRFSTRDHLKQHFQTIFGKRVPVGSGEEILIEVYQGDEFPTLRIGFFVCEDGWQKVTPGAVAAMSGANLIIGMATSNEQIGKPEWREVIARAESGMGVSVGYVIVGSGIGEDTTDHTYGGQMIFAERGMVTRNVEPFALDDLSPEKRYVIHQFDMLAIEYDQQTFSYQECAAHYGNPEILRVPIDAVLGVSDPTVYHHSYATIDPYPFVPQGAEERMKRSRYVKNMQIRGLLSRVLFMLRLRQRKYPNQHELPCVLGISGGVDSALAILIAWLVYRKADLPLQNIIAVTMPSFGTTSGTKNNAKRLAEALGVQFLEIPIGSDDHPGLANALFDAIGLDWRDNTNESLAFENGQAMLRQDVLYAISNMNAGFVLGTGDWSEGLIGWLTKYGDGAYDYGVNGGVAKTLVQFMIEAIANEYFSDDPAMLELLNDIAFNQPVSPELKRPRGDIIAQKTDEENGPVTLRDFFGYHYERSMFPPERLAYMALHAFSQSNNPSEVYDLATIKKWLGWVIPRMFGGQHKRDVNPPNPKVGLSNSGRYDRQWPATLDSTIWNMAVAEIPDSTIAF